MKTISNDKIATEKLVAALLFSVRNGMSAAELLRVSHTFARARGYRKVISVEAAQLVLDNWKAADAASEGVREAMALRSSRNVSLES